MGKKGPKVKPGLSTFVTHPQDLKEFIKPLFIEAQSLVPQDEWADTPVYIKATAGMRLVTEEQGRVIYDTICAFLSSTPDVCPFNVNCANMKTIDGVEEGYFGALSANFLSGIIDKDRAILHPGHGVLGALDLGGSSTQVSIYAKSEGSATAVQPQNFMVHSYLGYGVEKMAEKYLKWMGDNKIETDPCFPQGFQQRNGDYGTISGSGDYSKCKESLATALGLANPCIDGGHTRCQLDGVRLPAVGPDDKFLAMSVYYFALRSVLVALGKGGESIDFGSSTTASPEKLKIMTWPSPSLVELREAGRRFCSIPWTKMQALAQDDALKWEDFMGDASQRTEELPMRCRQTAYIDLLLGTVYGIPAEKHNVMVCTFPLSFSINNFLLYFKSFP